MIKFIFVLMGFMVPLVVTAHVKWFVDTESVIVSSHNSTPFYYLSSKEVLVWAVISILVVLIFSVLDRMIGIPKKLLAFAEKNTKSIDNVASIILGIFLISVSFLWNIVLIPEIKVVPGITLWLQTLQIVIGIVFVLCVFRRVASVLLILLYLSILPLAGPMAFFENIMLLTLAFYFLIKSASFGSLLSKLDKHSVEIVRIGTGVSLIIFAFTEKLSFPELGLSFLSEHHWNFMYNSGFYFFSDKLFVLSTGFAEMIFGVIFILGYLTRINTVLIASFFAMSVVTMATQFGQWEVEDLVVYSAAILFVFHGHGKTKFFYHIWPESVLHTKSLKSLYKYLFFKV